MQEKLESPMTSAYHQPIWLYDEVLWTAPRTIWLPLSAISVFWVPYDILAILRTWHMYLSNSAWSKNILAYLSLTISIVHNCHYTFYSKKPPCIWVKLSLYNQSYLESFFFSGIYLIFTKVQSILKRPWWNLVKIW